MILKLKTPELSNDPYAKNREGVMDDVFLVVRIEPTGAKRHAFQAVAHEADLNGTRNPVPVTLTIGNNSGTLGQRRDLLSYLTAGLPPTGPRPSMARGHDLKVAYVLFKIVREGK